MFVRIDLAKGSGGLFVSDIRDGGDGDLVHRLVAGV
jgi:hypothetical protein